MGLPQATSIFCLAPMPVSPFVVAYVPGTTRMHASGLRLPCRRHRPKQTRLPPRPLSAFYSGHTPSLRRFNHLTDQGQAPGTTPAAAAIPALVMHFDSQVTWLSGVIPRAHLALWPGFRHGIVSVVLGLRFQGAEHRSSSLTHELRLFAVNRSRSGIG